MDDKKQNSQNDNVQAQHVFEVRTMKTDNDAKKMQSMAQAEKPVVNTKEKPEKKSFFETTQPKKKEETNPFLSEMPVETQEPQIGNSTFAPKGTEQVVEKNNERIEDIAASLNATDSAKPAQKKNNKSLHIIMIIAIVMVVIGLVIFAVYIIRSRMIPAEEVIVEENPTQEIEALEEENMEDAGMYATDIPNYFSFDVESANAKDDIAMQLDTIRTNFGIQDEMEPISFIVTDKNDIPVSFHVFAVSAGMSFPEDVLVALEENFEIYAYNDPVAGVRYGFVIDTKNVVSLPQILKDRELLLPQAFAPVIEKEEIGTNPVAFNDSIYNGQAIRYANLNDTETYSIDYAIINDKLIVGTSKETLRAIANSVKSQTLYKEQSNDFAY